MSYVKRWLADCFWNRVKNMASKRDAWTRSSWGSWQTFFLKSLKFSTKFAAILHTSPHEVPDRYSFWNMWKNMYFLAGLGGQRPAQKGDAGTQVLCHEVLGWLCSLYRIRFEHIGFLAGLGRGQSASKGMRGHKSYVMSFLSDSVLETFKKIWVCCPAKLGSKYRGQKRFLMFLEGFVLETFDKHGLAGCLGEGKGQNHNNEREDIMNVKSQRAGWSTGKITKENLSEQLHSSQIH